MDSRKSYQMAKTLSLASFLNLLQKFVTFFACYHFRNIRILEQKKIGNVGNDTIVINLMKIHNRIAQEQQFTIRLFITKHTLPNI